MSQHLEALVNKGEPAPYSHAEAPSNSKIITVVALAIIAIIASSVLTYYYQDDTLGLSLSIGGIVLGAGLLCYAVWCSSKGGEIKQKVASDPHEEKEPFNPSQQFTPKEIEEVNQLKRLPSQVLHAELKSIALINFNPGTATLDPKSVQQCRKYMSQLVPQLPGVLQEAFKYRTWSILPILNELVTPFYLSQLRKLDHDSSEAIEIKELVIKSILADSGAHHLDEALKLIPIDQWKEVIADHFKYVNFSIMTKDTKSLLSFVKTLDCPTRVIVLRTFPKEHVLYQAIEMEVKERDSIFKTARILFLLENKEADSPLSEEGEKFITGLLSGSRPEVIDVVMSELRRGNRKLDRMNELTIFYSLDSKAKAAFLNGTDDDNKRYFLRCWINNRKYENKPELLLREIFSDDFDENLINMLIIICDWELILKIKAVESGFLKDCTLGLSCFLRCFLQRHPDNFPEDFELLWLFDEVIVDYTDFNELNILHNLWRIYCYQLDIWNGEDSDQKTAAINMLRGIILVAIKDIDFKQSSLLTIGDLCLSPEFTSNKVKMGPVGDFLDNIRLEDNPKFKQFSSLELFKN